MRTISVRYVPIGLDLDKVKLENKKSMLLRSTNYTTDNLTRLLRANKD